METAKKGQSSRVVSASDARAIDDEMKSVVPIGGV